MVEAEKYSLNCAVLTNKTRGGTLNVERNSERAGDLSTGSKEDVKSAGVREDEEAAEFSFKWRCMIDQP